MTHLLGVILAGGQSRRMGGGDKALLPLGGRPIMAHAIDRLAPQVAGLALSANGDPARFAGFGLEVLADTVPGYAGPLAGVLAGLDRAAEIGATHVVSAAADTPFFPRDLVTRLVRAAEEAGTPIAMAATKDEMGVLRAHPTFALWPVALRDDLRMDLGAGLRKVVVWTGKHGAVEVVFDADPFDPFFNVNTPEDLARAEEIWTGLRA